MASVACQPGCSPSMPPYRSPFPLRVYSSTWARGIVGTPSGSLRQTASRPPPHGSNGDEGPQLAPQNYWMSSGKSTVLDDFPRNKPAIRSLASAHPQPPRPFPPCTPGYLWTKLFNCVIAIFSFYWHVRCNNYYIEWVDKLAIFKLVTFIMVINWKESYNWSPGINEDFNGRLDLWCIGPF